MSFDGSQSSEPSDPGSPYRPSLSKDSPQDAPPPQDAPAPPQYGAPQYGAPQYGQSQYGQSQYDQSQYGQPQHGAPQPGQSWPPQSEQRGPRPAGWLNWNAPGMWLIVVGAIIALSQLGRVAEQLWGLVLLLPLAWALAITYRNYRACGELQQGSLWWIFGTAFPALAGLAILTGIHIGGTWIVAIGFVVIGLMSFLRSQAGGGSDRRRERRQRRDRRGH